ncbi:PhnD/SsuA/transferrin family substrate-binding protein [Micromonospora sp. NPDC005197]|uniref:phosphate/phosphite/phosphonate ABC transporter substrate-binding protein n=1 Tax=unclassified Micromonospora TaxID=2617518 RepID=UPI0033A10013
MPAPSVLMGAVAYDPKVVTIWEGFRGWLRGHGLDFDFVLYSHYERQVEDLVAGRIDAAWNSPLAWLRADRLATAAGGSVRALTMRDTDRDLTSVVVVRADSPVHRVEDLAGRVVATGAVDSPQATLIPLGHLAAAGVRVDVRRFDVGVGLHGDHVGGERDAARALAAGEVDAACMIDANHLMFVQEGTLPPEGTRIVAQTGRYDHCNMTVREPASDGVRLFGTLLRGMSYADPQVRPLLDLEGLTAWQDGRTTGYDALAEAVDASGFYAPDGRVTAADYRP